MSYNDKYPDMSAMYAVQFEYENKLKDKIKELEAELKRTRKALDVAKYAIKNIKDDMKKVKDGDDIWEIQKNLHDYCKTTIKKITALEQKDK